jgi:uncharacterized protein (TIGR00251 family)
VRETIIQVRVKPGARDSVLSEAADGTWLAHVKSRPIEGKANEELVALVARHFGCRRSAVSIRSGASGRMKLVRIVGEIPEGPPIV